MADEAVEKLTAVQRLEELLNERDERIAELEAKLDEEEEERDDRAWMWTKHSKSEEKESLPVPRLEIRWTPEGRFPGYNWLASYNLVYQHLLGHVMVVPLGSTKQGGGDARGPVRDGKVETPFRDGVHIMHDAWALRLPAYAICGGVVTKVEPGTDQQRKTR